MTSCQRPAETGATVEPVVYAPQPLQSAHLRLAIQGRLKHEQDGQHRGPAYPVPVMWLRSDGSEVAEGEPLVVYDTSIVEWWQQKRSRERDVGATELEANQLASTRALQTLQESQNALVRDREVIHSRLASLDAKDQEQGEILRLRVAQGEQRLQHARENLERLRALGDAGVSVKYLRDAEEKVARAEQTLRSPQLELEVFTKSGRSLERMDLALKLAVVEADLGPDDDSGEPRGGITSGQALRELRTISGSANLASIDNRLAHFQEIMDNKELLSSKDGALAFNPKIDLEVGDRYSHVNLAFVLQDQDLLIDVFLPESMRRFAPIGDAEGEAIISLPSRPGETFRARMTTVGSIVQRSEDKRLSGFRCALRPIDPLPVRPGMSVHAELLVPLPASVRAVPLWFVDDVGHPRVTLADGRIQDVRGFPFDARFIITGGLAEDALLRIPRHAPRADSVRVAGTLDPVDPIILDWDLPEPVSSSRRHYYRSSWILHDLVGDGSRVRAGDILAEVEPGSESAMKSKLSLVRLRGQRDTATRIAQIQADDNLKNAQVAWRKAKIAAEKARLDYYATRYASYELDEVAADVSRTLAGLDQSAASREAEDALADSSGFVSEHHKRQRTMSLNLAAIDGQKSALRHVAALRKRDWFKVMDDDESMITKRLDAYDSRLAFSRAQVNYQLAMNTARDRHEYRGRSYERTLALTVNHSLLAPRDGRVFYLSTRRGAPSIGEALRGGEFLMMPTSDAWQFEVEIPARFYERFEVGQELSCMIPALSSEPRVGVVQRVAPYFDAPKVAQNELLLRGSVGVTEAIFKLLVLCELAPNEADRAAPGLTAFLDIKSHPPR